MGDRLQRLREHSAGRGTYQKDPASTAAWGAIPVGRYSLVSSGGPRHAASLVDLHKSRQKKVAESRPNMLGPLFYGRSCLSFRDGVLLYKQFICPVIGHGYSMEVRCPHSDQEVADVAMQVSAQLRLTHLCPSGTGKLKKMWRFHYNRALTGGFEWWCAASENPPVWQLGTHLRYSGFKPQTSIQPKFFPLPPPSPPQSTSYQLQQQFLF